MNTTQTWRALVLLAAIFTAPIALADWAADEAEIRQRLADSTLAWVRTPAGWRVVHDHSS